MQHVRAGQVSLFGRMEAPDFDASFAKIERHDLGLGAWVELQRNWLSGHEQVFERMAQECTWREEDRVMYERTVAVPRLYATIADTQRDPLIHRMREAISQRYGEDFCRVSLAYYRDGRDSVAWHGDYVARRMEVAQVATVSVGAPRKFMLRPTGGGSSVSFMLGWGDLVVMGGTCQRTFQHGIPKVAQAAPRIAIMFRPVWTET